MERCRRLIFPMSLWRFIVAPCQPFAFGTKPEKYNATLQSSQGLPLACCEHHSPWWILPASPTQARQPYTGGHLHPGADQFWCDILTWNQPAGSQMPTGNQEGIWHPRVSRPKSDARMYLRLGRIAQTSEAAVDASPGVVVVVVVDRTQQRLGRLVEHSRRARVGSCPVCARTRCPVETKQKLSWPTKGYCRNSIVLGAGQSMDG